MRVCHPVSPAYSAISPPSISCHPGSLIPMDDSSEGSLIEMNLVRRQKQKTVSEPLRRRVTIDILPGDVLLEIFDYYVAEADEDGKSEEWHALVHVCQKWRYLVFRSPLRLNLRILCSAGASVREKLALWPPLPIIIEHYSPSTSTCGKDNVIAALGHNDRVCEIDLALPSSLLESVFAAMQKTFVALKCLWLKAIDDKAPVVSDSFLCGSAPHLRHLWLVCISFPFPVLRKLLLSAANLVTLTLLDIPHSAYFSPEVMVACLSTLTMLEVLHIGFKYPLSRPPREGRQPPPTRSVLPALTKLRFIGVSEYLEDLVTQIDAPLLNQLYITFFHQLIFDTPQLGQFLSRIPKLKAHNEARVTFSGSRAAITLPGRNNLGLHLGISCRRSDWQLSSLAQVCTSSFPQALIPMLEHLYILEYVLENVHPRPLWQGDLESNQWLELFHAFTTVKYLFLSREFVPRVAPTLQELVAERVTEVLPNLESIFLENLQESGFIPETIRQFIDARQLSDRPITVSSWRRQDEWSTIH